MSTTTRFNVSGMTCGGCERALTRAVSRVLGVAAATVSHTEGSATVTFDPAVATAGAIVEAIHAAGYQATEAPDSTTGR